MGGGGGPIPGGGLGTKTRYYYSFAGLGMNKAAVRRLLRGHTRIGGRNTVHIVAGTDVAPIVLVDGFSSYLSGLGYKANLFYVPGGGMGGGMGGPGGGFTMPG